MADFKQKGDKTRYSFLDALCIGRKCWSPGHYQHRAPTGSGSRNTGSPDTPCCLNRAYRGCPDVYPPNGGKLIEIDGQMCCESVLPEFDKKLADERKKDGWKKV